MVLSLKELSYEVRLARLNLPSQYYRRARGDMIEAYKQVKGTFSVDTPYIELEDTGSRGNEFELKEKAAKAVRLGTQNV